MKTSPRPQQDQLMIGYGSDGIDSPNKTISDVNYSIEVADVNKKNRSTYDPPVHNVNMSP